MVFWEKGHTPEGCISNILFRNASLNLNTTTACKHQISFRNRKCEILLSSQELSFLSALQRN